jgi:hypothetical protein
MLTLTVPVAEVLCGGLWLVGWKAHVLPFGAIVLLSSFVGLVMAHLAFGVPPRCGCFGVIDAYFSHLDAGLLAAAKSGGLLIACVCGILLEWSSGDGARS